MAKKKKSKIPARFRGKLLAAAGIFAAGSFVGSALDIPPMSAYFEITAPELLSLPDRGTSAPETGETADTLQIPQNPQTAPETPTVSVQDNVPVTAPEPEIFPEQETVPEPEILPEPAPSVKEPVTSPEEWMEPENDWMSGIFIPAEPVPSPVPDPEPAPAPSPEGVPEEWMDSPEWMNPDSGESSAQEPSSPQASSMTQELAGILENVAVFWSTADNKIHLEPSCSASAVLFAGTVEEAQSVRTDGWCRRCAEHLDGTDNSVFYIKGNSYADAGRIAASYTYADYLNGIPAEAFGG